MQRYWPKQWLIAVGVLVCTYAISVLWYVSTIPDIGIHCAFRPIINHVDPQFIIEGEADDLPEPGDRLIQVGDQTIAQDVPAEFTQVMVLRTLLHQPPDDPVRVRYEKADGQIHEVWCRMGTLPVRELVPSMLWFALKLGLFMVGALVYWKRPTDASAAQFFLLCVVTVGAYMGGYHWARIATQPVLILVFMVCSVVLPAVSLHFYLLFPRPKWFAQQGSRWPLLVIYGIPLLFLATLMASYFHLRGLQRGGASPDVRATAWELLGFEIKLFMLLASLYYLAAVACLIESFRKARDTTERKQVQWIMAAALLALVPIGYTLLLILMKPDDFGAGAATWPMFAASASLTAAFAVSITRYRLMQLDQIVSSGAMYFLISSAAGLVYYAVVLAGMFLADLVGSQVTAGPSLIQTLLVGATFLVLLLVFDLARTRFKRLLDRRFHRDKHQLDRTLQRMGETIERLVEPATVARRLVHASADLLHATWGGVYLRQGEPPIFCLQEGLEKPPPLSELSSGCPLVEHLKQHSVISGDGPPSAARRQLRFLGGDLAHALAHEEQLLAILVLGPKVVGNYSSDDLNLLAAFAQLTTLALENAEGHRTIDTLNRELSVKVDKISEQQRRILALQTQLRQRVPEALEVSRPAEAAAGELEPHGILGSSRPIRQVLHLVRKVAATPSAVLVRGESGTGKELLARALHVNSDRVHKPFVKVHCAALSPGLLESELFGHVKGAFTGAHRDKVGRFELANGGTLFLDEIGDIDLDVQTKLLRVLQEKTFERVGSSTSVQVDVRIVAATHQNLEELIEKGRFRSDLYYRLKVFDLYVPPLRERREDIPELVLHFLQRYAKQCGKSISQVDDDAMLLLKGHRWQGNIRELENVLERAVVVAEGTTIGVCDLPLELNQAEPPDVPDFADEEDEEALSPVGGGGIAAERAQRHRQERERLVRALAAANGNKAEAARAMGLARSTLISRLKKFGLS